MHQVREGRVSINIFFTSDLHLGHANIVPYCGRPFLRDGDLTEPYTSGRPKWASYDHSAQCAQRMNEVLIRNWNARVQQGDKVIHLGDFCCRGAERTVPGVMTKAETWESRLNGTIIHIKGNHDPNSSVKLAFDSAVMKFSGLHWLLVHRPPERCEEIPDFCDAVLCGHIHEKWSHCFVDDIPVINVGVDVNRFMPITKSEVLAEYTRAQGEMG